MEKILEFDEWLKIRGRDIETLKGGDWANERKFYNQYKIKADKREKIEENKIVHK